jgi:uncharacterized protein
MQNEIIEKVKRTVLNIEPSAEIILFGSRARNEHKEFSDWDFLVLLDGQMNIVRTDKIRNALYDIELDTEQIISSIIRSKEEWNSLKYSVVPLHQAVENDGIRI